MGQKLSEDKLGLLSHSAGNIQLAPSKMTIGGQQYVTTTTLVVALPALTANNRYQVYAVISAGSPILVISQNENSVGPVGYNRWKLVGSLYANGNVSVAFGSFVNTKGVPQTDLISGGLIGIAAQSGGAAKGTTSIDRLSWSIRGNVVTAYYEYAHTVAGVNGTGNYLLTVPFVLNTARYNLNTDAFSGASGSWNGYSMIGKGHVTTGLSPGHGICQPFSSTQFRVWMLNISTAPAPAPGGWGSNFFSLGQNDLEASFQISYESSALSNTPIEDL